MALRVRLARTWDRTRWDGTGQDGTGQDMLFRIMFGLPRTELWTVLLYVWYGWDRTGQEVQMTKMPLLSFPRFITILFSLIFFFKYQILLN